MSDVIEHTVRTKYGAVARSSLSNENAGVRAVAEAFGYSQEQLEAIPAGANLGLSCGNPTAFASLQPGEVVVDLGCGGGLDVFLAAQKVGPTGRAIGIDMTPDMIDRAHQNAAQGVNGQPITNVEFYLAKIDNMPLPDASVDCVISNCVINLAPDKPAVFREIARILKPGGRLAVSDLVLKQPLPEDLGSSLMAYVGCIAGAISIDDYRQGLQAAGFGAIDIVDTGTDLNAYAQVENQAGCCSPSMLGDAAAADAAGCCSTPAPSLLQLTPLTPTPDAPLPTEAETQSLHADLATLLQKYNVNDYAASVKIFAVKG